MSVKVWLKPNHAPIFFDGTIEFKVDGEKMLEIKRGGSVVALFAPDSWGWVIEMPDS